MSNAYRDQPVLCPLYRQETVHETRLAEQAVYMDGLGYEVVTMTYSQSGWMVMMFKRKGVVQE